MPSWTITISKAPHGKGIVFDENPLTGVEVGHAIVWANNDTEPHQLGTAADPKYFMAFPIAPGSSSGEYVVTAPENGTVLTYVDWGAIDPSKPPPQPQPGAATGTIEVDAVWQISIDKAAIGSDEYTYTPSELTGVTVGGTVSWMNNDDKPHWPGIKAEQAGGVGYPNFFMDGPIDPNSPSPPWHADPSVSGQTLTYADSLDTTASPPTGTIAVSE